MILFVVVILIIIVVVLTQCHQNQKEKFDLGITDSEKIKLLQCMLAIHEVFEKHNIWYVVSFGTLLGAVRHKNVVPWDDVDILIKFDEIGKMKNAFKELENLGYKTEQTYKLFRVYSDEKHFVDLFIIKNENGKIARCYTNDKICKYPKQSEEWWHKYFGFPESLIKDRKRYQLGSLYLWGPIDSWNLLRFWYGDSFLTTCQTHYLKNHNEYVTPQIKQCPMYDPPQF